MCNVFLKNSLIRAKIFLNSLHIVPATINLVSINTNLFAISGFPPRSLNSENDQPAYNTNKNGSLRSCRCHVTIDYFYCLIKKPFSGSNSTSRICCGAIVISCVRVWLKPSLRTLSSIFISKLWVPAGTLLL